MVDTLQGVDQLNGGAGTDTLNATLNAAGLVASSLTGIENVNVRVTTATGGLNLAGATGVTAVTVGKSTAAANVQNTGAAALGVANQNTAVTFGGSTATALTLNLDTVGTAATDIAIDIGTTTANAATSFVINAKDAHVTFAEAVAGAATTSASVAATGANEITFAGADLASLTSLTVTGAGSADFTGGALSSLKTLTAADGGVKATITNGVAGAVTVTTGAGADTITATAGGVKSIAVGAGNDKVTVTGDAASIAAATAAALKVTNLAALSAAIVVGTTDAAVATATAAAVTNLSISAADKTAIDAASIGGGAGAVDPAEKTNVDAIITPLQTAANTASTNAAATAAATSAIAATATVDLGAGNDSLTLGGAFATGATLAGGDGTDTLGLAKAAYATVSAFVATDLAKVTGFEVLSISDALVNADAVVDVSKITGIVSFKAAAGVTTGNTATATGLGANSTVELAGVVGNNGTLTATLKADTAADSLTLVLNKDFADDNGTTSTATAASHAVVVADVESLTVNSAGTNLASSVSGFVAVTGYKADTITNTLNLTGSNKLTSITVTGDQSLVFASTAAMTKLAVIDASANTAGVTIDASLAAATSSALTIKGTAKADTIKGGALGDTITLGAGNDTMDYTAGISKIGTGKFDTITDFAANTYGNSAVTVGAAGTGANADATKWVGDVLKFTADAQGVAGGVVVDVFANAANATTFLANNTGSAAGLVAALDSSTGNLYVDNTNDGVADFFIALTGVTTLTAAAFTLA